MYLLFDLFNLFQKYIEAVHTNIFLILAEFFKTQFQIKIMHSAHNTNK